MTRNKRADQIQKTTHKLLQLAQVNEPAIPVEQIVELRGPQIRYVGFEDELSGLIFREEGRPIIGINKRHSRQRQRFTIAHEFGHLELHNRNDLHIDRQFYMRLQTADDPDSLSQSIDPLDIEASIFATELLTPQNMLEQDLRGHPIDYEDDELIRTLAERYQVSLQLMIFRLTSLDLISV